MKSYEFITESEVISPNFGRRSPYHKNPDIDIPMYDPKLDRAWNAAYSGKNPQVPFDSFEVDEVGKSAHIVGIIGDKRIRISTTMPPIADTLVAAYNRGGFTDVPIEKVKLRAKPEESPPKKSHLKLVK